MLGKAHHTPRGFRNLDGPATPVRRTQILRWWWQTRHRPRWPRHVGPLAHQPRWGGGTPWAVTWLGHATTVVELGTDAFLIDPVWSERIGPLGGWVGPRRVQSPGCTMTALPELTAILISHDHYDHLDLPTVRRLARLYPEVQWVVPLGVDRLVRRGGARRVEALDWGDSIVTGDQVPITITAIPAWHSSGRGGRANRTLWCGFTLTAPDARICYTGDTAEPGHYRYWADVVLGTRPWDALILPVGAYLPREIMRGAHWSPGVAVQTLAHALAHQHPHRLPPVIIPVHRDTWQLGDEPFGAAAGVGLAAWTRWGFPPEWWWTLAVGETRGPGVR